MRQKIRNIQGNIVDILDIVSEGHSEGLLDLVVTQQLELSLLDSNYHGLVNIIETVTFDIEEIEDTSSTETSFETFLECINDPGITIRQLRDSISRVTSENVVTDNLDDFDQVLHTVIQQLRGS